ncbi:TRAF3-interacting JNK-activating modulator [Pangasianodon hypophthalmus]|uniref:TRAF3-interacting JNK-activating modulator n=1 Tax=Pangasianodon hypophthalmus TaxID=310915 RepID=UPI002307DA36|nr:TRAF3-interacting JNK-activating modulator [Pangasianodon hypophthalmus]XP_034162592.2 TRAF3-interacting JNK-activating modulator [Pangasianodon hypophthalmus]
MITLDGNTSQQCDYDIKLEQRAVKRRNLGDRNNVTTCRSPTRDVNTKWIKNELHRKRQDEFSKRRPADCSVSTLLSPRSRRNYAQEGVRVTQMSMSHRPPKISPVKQSVSTASLNNENALKHDSVAAVLDSLRQRKAKQERGLLRDITQLTNNHRTLHTASVQTESGTATVKDEDIQQLATYLEEALYREEVLKKKLTALQRSTSTLLHSTELLWKTRCDEDLLKNKIKTLEAQLQLCMKRVPQDGLKKAVLKMEKQKEEYEKKALEAIQKATEENSEAQCKLQNLQEALQVAQAESVRWQKLYEELKESHNKLRKSQDQCTDQLQQLQSQLQRSKEQEESLREQCDILQEDEAELRTAVLLLEQDNQTLREQLEKFTENSHGSWNNITEVHKQGHESYQFARMDSSIAEQLHQTEQRLSLKDKECVELKAELETLEQECYSYQTRLAQCREELNTLSARNSRSTQRRRFCGTLCLTLFFMLMLIAVMVAVWIYRPSVREQLREFYSVVEERVEDYLMQAASTQHAGCLRPV